MAEVKRFEYRPYAVKPVRAWCVQDHDGRLMPFFWNKKSDASYHRAVRKELSGKPQSIVRVEIRVVPKRRAKKGRK